MADCDGKQGWARVSGNACTEGRKKAVVDRTGVVDTDREKKKKKQACLKMKKKLPPLGGRETCLCTTRKDAKSGAKGESRIQTRRKQAGEP